MRNVARLPDSDRGELLRNTADKMGLNCNHAQLMSKRAYTSKHPGKARII